MAAPEEPNAGWIAARRKHAPLLDAETFAAVSRDRELMAVQTTAEVANIAARVPAPGDTEPGGASAEDA